MPEFCQSKETTVVPLFRMIWLAKDESGAKLTPFSNNGQGDFEITGVDKTVFKFAPTPASWVRLCPTVHAPSIHDV
jgi:hypothetical protein